MHRAFQSGQSVGDAKSLKMNLDKANARDTPIRGLFRREDLDSRVKPPPTITVELSFLSNDRATSQPRGGCDGTNRTPPRDVSTG
jgi:hypothetical protein